MEIANQAAQVTKPDNKQDNAIKRAAIKGDYSKWKGSLSYDDLVKWLETCYNEYIQWGNDLTLPRDTRNSYLDRAHMAKLAKDYIDRQA